MNIFKKLISLPGVLLLTAALYSITLKNGFINWDDPLYITENTLIRDISFGGILKIFSTLHFNGFLPVTQFSLAIDYFFWKDNPAGYHLTNFLLHLANIVIVYFLADQFTKNKQAALITCLLFAIHPMRVESVAWAAERKDVLYAFFYLLSVYTYIRFLKSNFKIYFFILSFLFFGLSVFSKWSAFPLPFLLIALDYYFGRKLRLRAILEKLLFITLPLISAYIHFSKGAIVAEHFSFFHRILLGSYALMLYISKLIFPFNLSAIYPYPKLENGFLPLLYYLSLFGILIAAWFVYFVIKKHPRERNFILFCILFFLLNVGMVLHILSPIGGVVVAADRYAYVAFFGLFLLAGKYMSALYNRHKEKTTVKNVLIFLLLFLLAACSYQTFQRNKLWKNSIVFFNNIIEKDSTIAFAWNNLGYAEADEGQQQRAIAHYTKAIGLNPRFSFAYNNRGLAHDALGNFPEAVEDFNRAISIKNYDPALYFNRGLTFSHTGETEKAIRDISTAIELNPAEVKYYIRRGSLRNDLGDYTAAANDFSEAIKLSPENAEAFNYLGLTYYYLGKFKDALDAYNLAISLDPVYSSAYNNRGWVRFTLNDKENAMSDFSRSIQLDPLYSFPYHNRGLLYYELNRPDLACTDWKSAIKLGYKNSQELVDKYCK